MAISPPGDIVLDVVRAAEPANVEAARARLRTLAESRSTGPVFSVGEARISAAKRSEPSQDGVPEAFTRFEAMVLQTFIQSMLPEDAENVYGGGVAGQMWQSMLAQQLGDVMAERGGIGIADRVLSDYYVDGKEKVPLQGVSADQPTLDAQRALSDGLVQEIQRRMAQSLAQDGSVISDTTEQ